MPYGSKKKPGSVAAGIAGGSKKAENNRVGNTVAALATVGALGQAFAPANNAVVMASGAAHDSGSPNSSGGGFDASQTSGHVADSNARRFPFNTSCDRALPTAAMPVSSPSATSQNVANCGAMRRDTAAAAAQQQQQHERVPSGERAELSPG